MTEVQLQPKNPFTKRVESAIKSYMAKRYPEEGCGVVVDRKFYPCDNVSQKPEEEFRIDPKVMAGFHTMGEVQAIVHSHVDQGPIPSFADQEGQIASDLIWGICAVHKGEPSDVLWWGDKMPFAPYTQRRFIWGVWHCFSLYRDWWHYENNVIIKNFPADEDFIREGKNHFLNRYERAHHVKVWDQTSGEPKIDITDLKRGDMLVANIRSPYPNHCGVYVGNDVFLHHPEGGLSRREQVLRYWQHVTTVLRYEKTT
jgi:proteasome lid subunit RPN8/RPN11